MVVVVDGGGELKQWRLKARRGRKDPDGNRIGLDKLGECCRDLWELSAEYEGTGGP